MKDRKLEAWGKLVGRASIGDKKELSGSKKPRNYGFVENWYEN